MSTKATQQERGTSAPSGGGVQPSETEHRGDRPMIESEVMAHVQRMTDDALDSMFNIAAYLASCQGGEVPKIPVNGNGAPDAADALPARPTHAIEVDKVVAEDFITFIRESGRNPLYEANAAMVSQLVAELSTADLRRKAFDEWCEGPRDSLTGSEAWNHDPMRERFSRESEGLVLGFGGVMDAFVVAIQPGRWVQVYDTESGATADGYVTQVKADYCKVKFYDDGDINKEHRVEWADISVVADRKVKPSGYPKGNGAKPADDAEPVDESERPALLAQAIDQLQRTPTDILKGYVPAFAEFVDPDMLKDEADDDTPEAQKTPPTKTVAGVVGG